MGRPSDFSQDVADVICERLIEGESLRTICRDEDMPSTAAVCRWLAQHQEFREQYAHARDFQADTLFDESLDIADNAHVSQMGCDPDVARDRLRVDTRKWMAGKLKPKKYGEKVMNEHSGPGGAPIATTQRIERVIIDPANPDG